MADSDTPKSQTPNDDPWLGQTLAGYLILRRLGEGGMGVVYLAQHQSLDRLAAVKFLPAEMAHDEAFVELFLREAKAAAKLAHPNIVDVHDAGVVGENIYYFIMEYVEGRELASILKDMGTIPPAQAAEYIRQAASALAYAHKKKIIHRDIKPENLLLTSESVIKVVDLGLAKWAGEEQSMLTQTGDIMGSPIFISPERLRDPHTADPRSDIYSLGGTFYNLVTGKIPYEGSSPVIMARHLTDPVPDPRDVNPDLDDAISQIIMKMMAKDLADRYQTMEEVEAAIKDYQSGKSATPAVAPAAGGKPGWLIPAVVVAVAAVGGFFVASLYFKPSAPKSEAPAAVKEPAERPKSAEPAKPVEPPKPAKPPLVIAHFNSDSRMNLLNDVFGAWASSPPDPVGRCSEKIFPRGGVDGTGCWQIDYDISTHKSFGGIWMHLHGLDATGYDAFRFRARTNNASSLSFIVELKVDVGSSRITGSQVIRDVGKDWIEVEIPLKSFKLPALKPLYEMTIVFNQEVTGGGKGTLFLDDIEFVRKP